MAINVDRAELRREGLIARYAAHREEVLQRDYTHPFSTKVRQVARFNSVIDALKTPEAIANPQFNPPVSPEISHYAEAIGQVLLAKVGLRR